MGVEREVRDATVSEINAWFSDLSISVTNLKTMLANARNPEPSSCGTKDALCMSDPALGGFIMANKKSLAVLLEKRIAEPGRAS
jgi:hypothetical protein